MDRLSWGVTNLPEPGNINRPPVLTGGIWQETPAEQKSFIDTSSPPAMAQQQHMKAPLSRRIFSTAY